MKKVFLFLITFLMSTSVFAVNLVFRVTPTVLFPDQSNYKIAFDGVAQADLDLFNFLTIGAEGGYAIEKPQSFSDNINMLFGGLGLGAYYYPLSRISLGAGGSFGVVNYSTDITAVDKSSIDNFSDLYWRCYGEVGFRVNPSFTINAVGGYSQFLCNNMDPFMSGPFAGISFRFSVNTEKSTSSKAISVKLDQSVPVFPVYSTAYSQSPIGTLIINNNEGAEIRDVHISFRAGKYTETMKECAYFEKINRHSSEECSLYANFSSELLKFSENGKINGEIVIDYTLLGKKMSNVQNVVISVNNRNAYEWIDTVGLAAFISPNVNEILQFAKNVSGTARTKLNSAMNNNIQYAAAMIEAFGLVGVKYSDDTMTPYSSYHLDSQLDSIQYPLQTLQCLSGDYDDLGLLLCSCLESIQVHTGYIATLDDFIVLVRLEMNPNNVLDNFKSEEGLIIDEESENVYLALSMKNFDKGFKQCFTAGAQAIENCFVDEENYYEFVDVQDAWNSYPPVAYSASIEIPSISETALLKRFDSAINDYIASDIEAAIKRARESGDQNKLGLALVRAGRYAEARSAFTKAANTGSVSAMINVANIYMIEKNYSAAAAQYKKVLDKQPENATAISGYDKALSRIE